MVLRDEEGRFLAIPIRTLEKGVHIWVINIYAPANTQEKKKFWEESIAKQMQRSQNEELNQRQNNSGHGCQPNQ